MSGSIIWARQIDQQLTMYLKRVEDVLGKSLESPLMWDSMVIRETDFISASIIRLYS